MVSQQKNGRNRSVPGALVQRPCCDIRSAWTFWDQRAGEKDTFKLSLNFKLERLMKIKLMIYGVPFMCPAHME